MPTPVRALVPRPAWIRLAAAWAAVIALVAVWLLRTPPVFLREQLKSLQFWSLEACLALGLALSVGVLREIGRRLERRDSRNMAALAVLALVLTLLVAPRTNRIYYDEQIYQNVGQNMSDLSLAQMCNDGTVEYGRLQCANGEYNKQPYAYPHLLSLANRVFGVREGNAFGVNAIVMAATVCALYLLVLVLFDDRLAAFFAALVLALTPEQIVWSATTAVEPSASMALIVALLSAAHFCRSKSATSLAAMAVATAWAVQFRQESLLVVPVIGLLIWYRAKDEFGRPRLWWAGLLCVALLAVHFGHLFAVRNEPWGTTGARLSLGYVAPNLSVNGPFYLGDERFPWIYTLLALWGLSVRRALVERASLIAYFALFFGIGLFFYAGSYNYGADVRYSLMTYPPLAAAAGLGAASLARRIERSHIRVSPVIVVTAGLVFQFLWYAPLVRATTEEAWAARADVRFAKSLVPRLRGNSFVLTHNPGMFHVWGVNAGQMSLALANSSYLDYLSTRYPGGVYLHWNFWCNVQDPVQRSFCEKALAVRPSEVWAEFRERDQRLVFYRLKDRERQN